MEYGCSLEDVVIYIIINPMLIPSLRIGQDAGNLDFMKVMAYNLGVKISK